MPNLLDRSVPEIVAEWYRLAPELEGIFAAADNHIAEEARERQQRLKAHRERYAMAAAMRHVPQMEDDDG